MYNFDMSTPPGRTYRYYTGTPLFPFGAGMSYTTFSVNTMQSEFNFVTTVTNTGLFDGDEVVGKERRGGELNGRAERKEGNG